MAKFKFAFDTLKKLRANKLLLARKEMIEVESKVRDVLEDHRRAAVSRAQLFDMRDEGKLPVGELQLTMDLITSQTQKMGQLEKKNLTLQGELERHRNWVAHLGKELKIVDKLEEKQRNAFLEAERMQEKKTADRWVAERWAQKVNFSDVSEVNES